MNIQKAGRLVIKSSIQRWLADNSETPKIANADFEEVRKKYFKKVEPEKFLLMVGLYLLRRKFLAGQLTQYRSVVGFEVMADGIDWANESFYDRNRDISNVFLGAIFSIAATVVINLSMPSEISISEKTLQNIKSIFSNSHYIGSLNIPTYKNINMCSKDD